MHAGEKKVHEVVNNMWRWEIKDFGEKKAQKLMREKRFMGRNKGCRKWVQHKNIDGEQSEEEKG